MSFVPNNIAFRDSPNLDAFSRLRVSQPQTQFQAQQEYGLDTVTVWDATANGTLATASTNASVTNGSNAVGPTNANTRLTPITVSATSGHYSVLQSKRYMRYNPGKGFLCFVTGVFSPGTLPNTVSRVGYFDDYNGVFLEVQNGIKYFVERTSTSGSVSDANKVAQSAWNIDKLDGTGPSGLTIDLSKCNILYIQAQWLGSGRVICGFDIDGQLIPCHAFNNANAFSVPYTQSFNLPIRAEVRNTGTSTGTPTIQFLCTSVISEGGQEVQGTPRSIGMGITSTAVTTRRAVLSIRPKATYNGRTNRGYITVTNQNFIAKTNDMYYEIVVGGTLGGTPAWTSVDSTSIAEYDTAGTTVTGGVVIGTGYALAGSGSSRSLTQTNLGILIPLVLSQIDGLTADQTVYSIVCTALTGTSNVSASLDWLEQTT